MFAVWLTARGRPAVRIVPTCLGGQEHGPPPEDALAQNTPIPFDEGIRQADTDRAMQTLKPALIPDDAKPWAIDFSGTCPRCGDAISMRRWLFAVTGAVKMTDQEREALARTLDAHGWDRSRGDETFDLECSCSAAHPGRPKDRLGCGARFRVRVSWP